MSLNLYYVSQHTVTGYDTYSDCVVAAADEEAAKRIHPSTSRFGKEWWKGGKDFDEFDYYGAWPTNLEQIDAELIGTAVPAQQAGVICSSFHAG